MVEIVDWFKSLPGMENRYTPRSDYLYVSLQPIIEDAIFLGRSYEDVFAKFEVLLALTFADLRGPADRIWGPPGRFAWSRSGEGSYNDVLASIASEGSSWGALSSGFFDGDMARFSFLSEGYRATIGKFGWW
jgi:hypothetical protein